MKRIVGSIIRTYRKLLITKDRINSKTSLEMSALVIPNTGLKTFHCALFFFIFDRIFVRRYYSLMIFILALYWIPNVKAESRNRGTLLEIFKSYRGFLNNLRINDNPIVILLGIFIACPFPRYN